MTEFRCFGCGAMSTRNAEHIEHKPGCTIEKMKSDMFKDCFVSPGSEMATRFGLISQQQAVENSIKQKLLTFEQWQLNNPDLDAKETICHGCAGLGFTEDGQCYTCKGIGGISEARLEYNRQIRIALDLFTK